MNKKIFSGLALFMLISILGIIVVQIIWINNAIKIRDELFIQNVNEALNTTGRKLEEINDLTVLNELVLPDTTFSQQELLISSDIDSIFFENLDTNKIWYDPDLQITVPDILTNHIDINVERENEKSLIYEYRNNSQNNFNINTDTLKQVIILEKDTFFNNIDSVFTMGLIKIDSITASLETLNIFKPDITNRIEIKAGNLANLSNRILNEVRTWDIRTIDENLTIKILNEELKNKNILLDYEYGIYAGSELTYKSELSDSVKLLSSLNTVLLYPNDIFQKNIKLAVYFPGKKGFIFRSLNWLMILSFLFTMFILITFLLSIYFIIRQKKISEMKSDFIDNMTHEFKTPIATISVASDSLFNEKVINDPEKIRYFSEMIKKENIRMNHQVEDILTIARLDRKDFDFKWQSVNIHNLIEEAILSIKLQIEKRKGKITTNLSASNPVVTTDSKHITNVIYNMLDNSNKYSVKPPEISVSTKNTAKGIVIIISDKGIGMSKQAQSKIFEKFYRQPSGNIHNVKGFGLGLNYAKAVISANGGEISVRSKPGEGSTFEIFVPFIKK